MNMPLRWTAILVLLVTAIGCTGAVASIESRPTPPSASKNSFTPAITQPFASRTPTGMDSPGAIGSIHPIRSMLTSRAAHTATLLQNGKVLITGGFGRGENSYTNSAELYDPVTGNFVPTGDMAIGRCCHTATLLPDGRVLISGGFNGEYLSDAEIYDPKTGKFTATGRLTMPRMDQAAVLLENGQVLLAGGVGTGWTFLASAELYDPASGTFSETGSMSVPRESHTITKLTDGRVLITGGHQGRHSEIIIYDSAEIYNPATGRFASTGNMGVPRHKHDAVLLSDGNILISGGSDEHDDEGAYSSTEIFDPTEGNFHAGPDMPTARYKHIGTSLLLQNDQVLIAGGGRNAVVFDPVLDSFSMVPGDMGSDTLSRLFSTATLLKNGSVLITGGYGLGQNVSAKAWIYSP